jgi:N,N'-diacetylchitobiose transport system permease protein
LWRAVAAAFVGTMVFPVYWMVNSAFEPNGQISSLTPSFFPVNFTFHDFVEAVNRRWFWADARNSLMVVSAAVVVVLVVTFLAAMGVARFRLRGANTGGPIAVA